MDKKLNILLAVAFVAMLCCFGLLGYGLYTMHQIQTQPPIDQLPGFVLPEGYKRIPCTIDVIDRNGDTLEINHTIKHQYSFAIKE